MSNKDQIQSSESANTGGNVIVKKKKKKGEFISIKEA